MNTVKGSAVGYNIPAGANGPASPNDWSVEKDESGFTIRYDNDEMYEIPDEYVHKRVEHLSEEEQLELIVRLLSETFRFEYLGDGDVVED